MKTKFTALILLLCVMMSISGCKYTKDEETNTASPDSPTYSQSSEAKKYTEEEITKINNENKYPKVYIKNISEEFNSTSFNSSSPIEYYNVVIKDVNVVDNVTGLEENDFLDFDEDVKVCLDDNNKFRPYDRISYTVINGGLDIEKVDERKGVQPELVLIDFVLTNTSDKEVEATITPGLNFMKYSDFDSEFVQEKNEHIQYESTDGKYFFSDGPVYFPQSQYKTENEITRGKKFFVYDFEPNERLECTLGFIIDKDLEDDMYLSFIGDGQFDTLVKVF